MPNLDEFFSRIQTDCSFHFRFRQDPEGALESYELSAEERAAVTGSRQQLWTRVGRSSSYWKIGCNCVMPESDELEFNPTAALGRPEIRNTIGEIKESTRSDRLTPVLALIQQIG